MHTVDPMRRATAWYSAPVHPIATKMRHVAISVAIVMPEIGFDEEPMIPTIRLETVTKKNPKTTISTDMINDPGNVPGMFGRTAMMTTRRSEPPTTHVIGMSRAVRSEEHTSELQSRFGI